MPAFSRDDIANLAALSRLALTEEELDQYANELSAVFGYIETLRSVPTDGVPETCQVTGLENVTREDIAISCDKATGDKLIEAFPESAGRMLKVKAVFGDWSDES